MTNRLSWSVAKPYYESGVDRGVFYPRVGPGEAWQGLTAVNEDDDSENSAVYIDGQKIVNRRTAKSFSGSIEAYTYSDSFEEEVFTARRPKPFGLSYRIQTGRSYKLHLVYNVLVAPSPVTREHEDEVNPFQWGFSTTPVLVTEGQMGAHLVVDVENAYPWTVEALENTLYGTDVSQPSLPSPLEVFALFEANSLLIVTDNGDGTYSVTGPDDAILMLDADTFEISWPSAQLASEGRFTIYSL